MKRQSFTLVELMVVVVVAALLAAVSVPYFRDYRSRAQLASVFPAVEAIKKNAFEYFARHGRFPDAVTLGLDSPQAQLNDPTTISPYLTDLYVISTDFNDEGYTCTGAFGEIWMFYDPAQVGVSDGGFDFGVFIYYAVIDDLFVTTAEDTSESGTKYVQQLISSDYPDFDSLFTAAGCSFS